jgi:hypothetical protein
LNSACDPVIASSNNRFNVEVVEGADQLLLLLQLRERLKNQRK